MSIRRTCKKQIYILNISKYGRDHCRVSLTKCPWDAWSTSSYYTPGKLKVHGFAQNLSMKSDIQQSVSLGSLHLWQVSANVCYDCVIYHVWPVKTCCFLFQGNGAQPKLSTSWKFLGLPNAYFGLQHWSQALKTQERIGQMMPKVFLWLEMIIPDRTDTVVEQ